MSLILSMKKGPNKKSEHSQPCEKSVSVGLSLCAPGACEEKAKVKRSYSNSHKKNTVRACAPLEHEFECEDILLLHTQKNRVSLSLSVRIFSPSHSNPHSLWPLCPEQESLTAVRQGTCTIFLIKLPSPFY